MIKVLSITCADVYSVRQLCEHKVGQLSVTAEKLSCFAWLIVYYLCAVIKSHFYIWFDNRNHEICLWRQRNQVFGNIKTQYQQRQIHNFVVAEIEGKKKGIFGRYPLDYPKSYGHMWTFSSLYPCSAFLSLITTHSDCKLDFRDDSKPPSTLPRINMQPLCVHAFYEM